MFCVKHLLFFPMAMTFLTLNAVTVLDVAEFSGEPDKGCHIEHLLFVLVDNCNSEGHANFLPEWQGLSLE